jgi:hypothetical protein
MSFASILGPSNSDPAPKPVEKEPLQAPAAPKFEPSLQPPVLPMEPKMVMQVAPPVTNGAVPKSPVLEEMVHKELPLVVNPRKKLTNDESDKIQKALADIEDASYSDVDVVGFYDCKLRYVDKGKKRIREQEASESKQKKVGINTSWVLRTDLTTAPPHTPA